MSPIRFSNSVKIALYKTAASVCTFYVNRRSYERSLQPRSYDKLYIPVSFHSVLQFDNSYDHYCEA